MLRIRRFGFMAGLALMAALPAQAAPPEAAALFDLPPVSDARLDRMRGGFSIGGGSGQVQLSLGIERMTFINGELAAVNRMGQSVGGGLRVISNGVGNTFDSAIVRGLLPGTLGTVIQNSMDNQVIRNLNVLHVTVTSQELARSLAVRSMVSDSVARAVR